MDVCCCLGPAFFIFGVGMIYGGVQRYRLIQKIKNLPTSKVRSAAVGLVELAGRAKCMEPLTSPVSKAKCVYWRVKGEYYYQGRKSSGWRDCYGRHSSSRFYLEDDTGRMLIEPKEGEVDVPQDLQSTGHLSGKALFGLLSQNQLDPRVLAYMDEDAAFGNALRSHSGTRLRVTEYFIAEGDQLYVLGTATPLQGASSSVSNESLIVQKNQVDGIMYVTDSGENKAVDRLKWQVPAAIIFGLLLAVVGLIVTFTGLAGPPLSGT